MVAKRTKKTAKPAKKAAKPVYLSNRDVTVEGDADGKTIMVDFNLAGNPIEDLERFPESKRGTGRTLAVVKGQEIMDGVFIHATIFTRGQSRG